MKGCFWRSFLRKMMNFSLLTDLSKVHTSSVPASLDIVAMAAMVFLWNCRRSTLLYDLLADQSDLGMVLLLIMNSSR